MMHLYEVDGGPSGTWWDIYDSNHDYLRTVDIDKIDSVIKVYQAGGLDFCLHTLEEYDEYHLALEKANDA